MKPADLHGRRVVVLGVGIDVAATLPTLTAAGPSALDVVDADPARARRTLDAAGLDGVAVHERLADAPPADVAVRSPGFSPYQPEVARRVAEGLVTVTPLGLWLSVRGERPSVAITGTKGKSSTSVLTQVALERLGTPAVVLGNIGVPPWRHAPEMAETAVLEISSYQAADLPFTAAVAALTAVGEDHVDWHGSVPQYHADKARVFTAPLAGDGVRWSGMPAGIDLPEAFAGIDFEVVPAPPGDLRARNARLAAAAALAATGGDRSTLDELAADLEASYPDLPGRFSTVATIGGIDFIDDALGSNPVGLAAALRTLDGRAVSVIVGGTDRGASIEPVLEAIAAARARRRPWWASTMPLPSPTATAPSPTTSPAPTAWRRQSSWRSSASPPAGRCCSPPACPLRRNKGAGSTARRGSAPPSKAWHETRDIDYANSYDATVSRASVRREVRIHRPASEVWAAIGDPARVQEWFVGIDSSTVDGDQRV